MIKDAYKLTASEALALFASGKLTSVELVKSCLGQITATDHDIHAWVYLDPNAVIAQAAECDRIRKAGLATGPLHGIPVALKDIIDTADMPTGRGTPIFKGRRTEEDARLVELLRQAGAVIIGKTVTTELAFVHTDQRIGHSSRIVLRHFRVQAHARGNFAHRPFANIRFAGSGRMLWPQPCGCSTAYGCDQRL